MSIGEICKNFRKSVLGLRQDQLATKIGVSQASLSQFEHGDIRSYRIFIAYVRLGVVDYMKENDLLDTLEN